MLLRLKAIRDEYPPLVSSMKPLQEAARKVDALAAKIKKEEKNAQKSNIFG